MGGVGEDELRVGALHFEAQPRELLGNDDLAYLLRCGGLLGMCRNHKSERARSVAARYVRRTLMASGVALEFGGVGCFG